MSNEERVTMRLELNYKDGRKVFKRNLKCVCVLLEKNHIGIAKWDASGEEINIDELTSFHTTVEQ